MKQFLLEGFWLDRVREAATRLYSERRMDGDEMRDMAQMLDGLARSAIEMPEDQSPDPFIGAVLRAVDEAKEGR